MGLTAPAPSADDVLRAVAEPNRRAILRLVAVGEMAAGDIATHFDVSRPAISQHIAVLRSAGLLTERRVGARRLYRARPEGFVELRAFLAEMWPDALERFRAQAERSVAVELGSEADRREGSAQ